MKTNVMRRIIKASKGINPVLNQLCKWWKPMMKKNKNEESVDPVSCVLFLQKRRTEALISTIGLQMLLISCVYAHILRYASYYPTIAYVFASVAFNILLPLGWCMFCESEYKKDWRINNALDFIEAIDIVEELSLIPFERWLGTNEDGPIDPGFVNEIKGCLSRSAIPIDDLKVVEYLKAEHFELLIKWKYIHALASRLLPQLPKDYDEYFPKPEPKKASKVLKTA